MATETFEDDVAPTEGPERGAIPGLVAVFSGGSPHCTFIPMVDGALEIGRTALEAAGIVDGKASRVHARVERSRRQWHVRDLGSRNGTYVDGRRVSAAEGLHSPLVRLGSTLLLAIDDGRPFQSAGVTVRDGLVIGPALQAVHERVAAVARSGSHLLLAGESGVGKEHAARRFHTAARGSDQPFVAVNCATISPDLAERVLFGARRGAYTGADQDAAGLVQAAHRGTLFLDEIAELDPAVQAKLLRVIETRTVTPLGGVTALPVDVHICAASLKNLRVEVAGGRFREDLYFRIGRPALRIPPLRERREEIPWLIQGALERLPGEDALTPSVELVEDCLMREWPGNVRELVAEIGDAALIAAAHGRARIALADLDRQAGRSLRAPAAPKPAVPTPDVEALRAALRIEDGNVVRTALRLGLSRGRLRRLLDRHGIDPRTP